MTINPEQQHDEHQQTAIWPEEVSNEGHVYVALGVSQQEIDIWMQPAFVQANPMSEKSHVRSVGIPAGRR